MLSQKERFFSTELFDCPICGQPVVKIESQLDHHIGCLAGHYDMYALPQKIMPNTTGGKNFDYRKELVTTHDGYFICTVYLEGDNLLPSPYLFLEIYDSEYNNIWCSESFEDIVFQSVSDWIGNSELM